MAAAGAVGAALSVQRGGDHEARSSGVEVKVTADQPRLCSAAVGNLVCGRDYAGYQSTSASRGNPATRRIPLKRSGHNGAALSSRPRVDRSAIFLGA